MKYLENSDNIFSEKFQCYHEEMIYNSKGATQQNIWQSPFP